MIQDMPESLCSPTVMCVLVQKEQPTRAGYAPGQVNRMELAAPFSLLLLCSHQLCEATAGSKARGALLATRKHLLQPPCVQRGQAEGVWTSMLTGRDLKTG